MKREPFVLPPAVRRMMVAHAARERPHECCGLLAGVERTIDEAMPMRNVADDPATRFQLDPREHIEMRRALRRMTPSRRIVGVYHSHPSSAPRPSDRDVAEAHYPDWLYVIVGFASERPRLRAFALESGRMLPVRLISSSLRG